MKIVKRVLLGFLVLMSLAAGVAKIMKMPQELVFFEAVGMSPNLLIPFGLLHVVGAVLTLIPKTRIVGLLLMASVFFVSAVMIFMDGNTSFAIGSIIPAALAVYFALGKWGLDLSLSK